MLQRPDGAASPADHVPVLIVGGGPIGLALAADLGRRHVRTMLIEQNEDRIGSAKMIVVSVRTMEFCRQLGVADSVRNWGFPLEHSLDSIFCTTLVGHELGRVRTPSLATEADTPPYSPERERPCPQTWFDPILQEHARRFEHVTLLYGTRLTTFEQNESRVLAEVVDKMTGAARTITADYLVACDGYGSTVRDLLGIEVRGNKHLDLSMSVYVRSSELRAVHAENTGYRYVMVGPNGPWAVLTTIDGRDLWRIQLIGVDVGGGDKLDVADIMRRMVGRSVTYTVEDISTWVRKMTVADRFLDGRVFLAGDAAHAHPPNGGLGMNTGIQDAFDLGWKLQAVLEGWGGPILLESYDWERRPASARAASESLRNYHRLTGPPREPRVDDPGPTGEAARARLGTWLVAENEKAWHPVGVHLGYCYDPSPIVFAEPSPRPIDDTVGYTPSSRPGGRAPHIWLADNRSILDLFGSGFVLLDFAGVSTERLVHAAQTRGVPLTCHRIENAEAQRLYGQALVLVRPDGHIAWRGDSEPADVLGLVDLIRGAGSRIAVRHGRPSEHPRLPIAEDGDASVPSGAVVAGGG